MIADLPALSGRTRQVVAALAEHVDGLPAPTHTHIRHFDDVCGVRYYWCELELVIANKHLLFGSEAACSPYVLVDTELMGVEACADAWQQPWCVYDTTEDLARAIAPHLARVLSQEAQVKRGEGDDPVANTMLSSAP